MTIYLIRNACARYEADRLVTDDMRFARAMLAAYSHGWKRGGFAISRTEYAHWRDRAGWTNADVDAAFGGGADLVERSRHAVGVENERRYRQECRDAFREAAERLWPNLCPPAN